MPPGSLTWLWKITMFKNGKSWLNHLSTGHGFHSYCSYILKPKARSLLPALKSPNQSLQIPKMNLNKHQSLQMQNKILLNLIKPCRNSENSVQMCTTPSVLRRRAVAAVAGDWEDLRCGSESLVGEIWDLLGKRWIFQMADEWDMNGDIHRDICIYSIYIYLYIFICIPIYELPT